MITLPNGVELDREQEKIAEIYNFKCVCHPTRWCTTLHEEPPKSKNPQWRIMPETRFPLCHECHELCHTLSRQDAGYMLEQARRKNFTKAEKQLEALKKTWQNFISQLAAQ